MTGRGQPDQSPFQKNPGPALPLEKPHAGKAAADHLHDHHPWATHEKERPRDQPGEQNPLLLPGRRNADPRPSLPRPQSQRRKTGGEVATSMQWVNGNEIETEKKRWC